MDQLYPIIRRKRRPLVQENPEMVKAEPAREDVGSTTANRPTVMSEPAQAVLEPVKITTPKKPRDNAPKN